MMKRLLLLALVSAPLFAYSFDTYFNNKEIPGNKNERVQVATKEHNSTHFKTFVDVSLNNPKNSCLFLSFGAPSQNNWENANVLALGINPSQPFAYVTDLIGGAGTNVIKAKAASQDWEFVKPANTSDKIPSFTYSSGDWKVEVVRPYTKIDAKTAYNVASPGESGVTAVAINLFSGNCPTGAASYSDSVPIIGGYAQSSLKPTAGFGAISLFSWTLLAAVVLTGF